MHLHIIKTAGGRATIKARMAISDSVERAIMKDRMGEKRKYGGKHLLLKPF